MSVTQHIYILTRAKMVSIVSLRGNDFCILASEGWKFSKFVTFTLKMNGEQPGIGQSSIHFHGVDCDLKDEVMR